MKGLKNKGLIEVSTITCNVRQREYNSTGSVPFIRTSDVGIMEMLSTMHKVQESVYERENVNQDIKLFDILMVKDGGKHLIGNSLIWLETEKKAVFQGHFYKIRTLDIEQLNPYYLYWALLQARSSILNRIIAQSTLYSITTNRLLDVSVLFPSKKRQEEIGNKMKQILADRRRPLKEYSKLRVK